MFGKEILEAIVQRHPDSFPSVKLLENFHHFEGLYHATGGWHHGWGSYLFNGQDYKYQAETLRKQEALYKASMNAKHALEIGVYLGHSLLIMLISNPNLKITCIDIDGAYPPKAVEYLNKHFQNRVTFILSDAVAGISLLPDNTYDLIHIDADHYDHAVYAQFRASVRVAKPGATIVFDDYEAVRNTIDGFVKEGSLDTINIPWCLWTNYVGRLTAKTGEEATMEICRRNSALSVERLRNNMEMIRRVNTEGLEGDIVEIGIYKGGSMLAMMKAHTGCVSAPQRHFHLYDTFAGMTEPTKDDVDLNGYSAQTLMNQNVDVRCICGLDHVQKLIRGHSGLEEAVVHYHVGDILKNTEYPEKIAVLRLDTDWYESTAFELEHFYPLVVPGGAVIIDDYGHWMGAKKAVDEFLAVHPELVLQKVDYTGVYFIKPVA